MQYWVDSLGYHQTDNHPRFDLKPVTETPEVKAAREEHERLWKEAARLNGVEPDLYNPNADRLYDESFNGDNDRELEGQVSNQHQSFSRYPILPYSEHISPENAKSFGKVNDDTVVVESTNNNINLARFARQQREEIEDVTSEPRGFFYSFDYPVPYIVERNMISRRGQIAEASENIPSIINVRSLEDKEETNTKFENTYREKVAADENILPLEVHDVQTSPKQQAAKASESLKSIVVPSAGFKKSPAITKSASTRNRGSVKFNFKS